MVKMYDCIKPKLVKNDFEFEALRNDQKKKN